jgi:hypothetical protein
VKDFDAERTVPRSGTFKICDETFHYLLGLPPERVSELTHAEEDGLTDAETAKTSDQIRQTAGFIDREIEAFLTNDQERERWRELRSREKSVGLNELVLIQRFLWQQEAGRDPTQPIGSSPSPGGNGTPSTVTSSPGQAEASNPST